MKKFLLFCLLLATGMAAKAQTTNVATLLDEHGNHKGTYYGANALKEALNVANHGYTIVLSPGQFNSAITLDKLITIRGAGMCTVPEKNIQPTILNGTITFNYSLTWDIWQIYPDYCLKMEGICTRGDVAFANNSGLKNAQFTKCTFGNFYKAAAVSQYRWENVSFVDCYMLGNTALPAESSVSFYNCVVKAIKSQLGGSTVTMSNCVLLYDSDSSYGMAINQGLLRNCFIVYTEGLGRFPPVACVCEYCYSTTPNFFKNQVGVTNTVLDMEISDIFKNFDGANWTDTYNFYELNDWATYELLGSDGSQMGIYGGRASFNPLTSAPQITRFEAPETTSNGQLKVTIQVELPN